MPIVGGGSVTISIGLLPVAPSASDSSTTFVFNATNFYNAIYLMVGFVNDATQLLPRTALTTLPVPPQALASDFASAADTFVAALPGLVTGVNAMIDALSLSAAHVSTLPATPSRGSDPTNFATEAAAFLAAMTTFRTELNAFITALNAFNPNSSKLDATLLRLDSTTHTMDEV